MTNSISDRPAFLASFLEHLLQQSDCVTFYEATQLLDAARTVDRIADAALQSLIQLHDAAHATDGAREVLLPYIKAQTTKRVGEAALGRRPVVLADHNKVARAKAGQSLNLHLAERRASGFLWRVVRADGPVHVARQGDRADAPSMAFFEVVPEGQGVIDIGLTEAFEGRHRPPNIRERIFALRIYADGNAHDLVR